MIIFKFIVLLVFLNQRIYCADGGDGVEDKTNPMIPMVEAAIQSPESQSVNLTDSTSQPESNETINSTSNMNITTPPTVANTTVIPSENSSTLNIASSSSSTPSAVITPLNVTEMIMPVETCPAECKCAPSLVDAICTGRGLQDIPLGFSSRVKMLILTSNNITEIGENCFKERNLFELLSLLMNHNQITTLHPNAFVVLKHLEVLDLGDNRLTILSPDLFTNNMALTTLRLDSNTKLQIPESGALINAPSLHDLNISSCNISFLPNDIFSGTPILDTIDLSGNNLKELNPLVLKSLPDLVAIILPKSFEPKSHEICLAHEKLEKIVISNKGNEENIECGKLLSNTSKNVVVPQLITVENENHQDNGANNVSTTENTIQIANLTTGVIVPKKTVTLNISSQSSSDISQNNSNIRNDNIVPVVSKNTESISSMDERRIALHEAGLNRIVSQTDDNNIKTAEANQGLSGSQIDNIIIGILLTIITVTGAAIIINLNKQKIDAYFKKRQRRPPSNAKTNEFEIEPLKNVVANQ